MITEEDYIKKQGKIPLKQNIIRQLIRNLIGQYRSNPTNTIVYAKNSEDNDLSDMMGNAIRNVHDINLAVELEAANFEAFAISGAVIGKFTYRYIPQLEMEDVYEENINFNRIFFNSDIEDVRLNDLTLIGQIIDLPLQACLATFASSKEDEDKIKQWYSVSNYQMYVNSNKGLSSSMLENLDFYFPSDPGKCRIFEIWQKVGMHKIYAHDYSDGSYKIVDLTMKEIGIINAERVVEGLKAGVPQEEIPLIEAREKYVEVWYAKYLDPYGHVLREFETPYDHKEHPFVATLHPLLNGDTWGIVEDVIDQQRYVNRLITQMSTMIDMGAKDLLLVPEECIPADMDISDFADEWSKQGGVIRIKVKPGCELPQQITSNTINPGASELLATQLKMAQDIAGIQESIQGKTPTSGTPSSLYEQESVNSAINVKHFVDTFITWKEKRDNKIMKLIKQYYNEPRMLTITGSRGNINRMYDPDKIKPIDMSLKVVQGTNTPVYRQMIDDTLMMLFEKSVIDVKMFLENSSLPFADKLLDSINKREQEMQQQPGVPGAQQPPSPEMMQQIGQVQQAAQQQADPKKMAALQSILGQQQTQA